MRLLAVPLLVAATLSAQTTIALPASTYANGIQVDSAGNIYVAGDYFANPSDPNAPAHAFVAKLSPDGSQTLWRTNLAGSADDRAVALGLGPAGAVYVTGETASTDFPVSESPYSRSGGGFAVELNSSGAVVYSTLIPVSTGQAIVVDSAGDAYITGILSSGQAFTPTPGAVSGLPSSAPKQYKTGYLLELDPTGSKAMLAIQGFGGNQIALDLEGNIYLAGSFVPVSVTTADAFQPSVTAQVCFTGLIVADPCTYQHVAKIDPTGTKLFYATYLDGVYGATINGLVVDSSGNAILAGSTASPDYPTTPDAFQPEYSANPSLEMAGPTESAPPGIGYITKLNASGTALVWSTFLGGSGAATGAFRSGDIILGLALDSAGNILVAGEANSSDFPGLWTVPVASRPAVTARASPQGFAARLTPDGTTLSPVQLFPNFLRDLGDPTGGAIVAIASGSVLIAGANIFSATFPALGRVHMIEDPADAAEVETVAPGQLLSLYGSNLAPEGIAPYSNGYPASYNGVTVTFNGIPAPLLYTAPNQINLEVPSEIAGQAQVVMAISSQNVSPVLSEQYYLAVAASRPSIFISDATFAAPLFDRWGCDGQTLSGIQPLAFNSDGTLNSCDNPAAAGSMVTVFLNGLGVTNPAQTTGAISPSAVALTPAAAYISPTTGQTITVLTTTLTGDIADVIEVQFPAPATSSAITLEIPGVTGVPLVRGPGVLVWAH